MRIALEAQDWLEVGRQIAEEWTVRKRLAPGVTTPDIDTLIQRGYDSGARAAKVCGAGGGGCIFFLVDSSNVPAVRLAVERGGAQILDIKMDPEGLRVR